MSHPLLAQAPAIKRFKGNRIKDLIDGLAYASGNQGLRDVLRDRICLDLDISKRFTQMLNNKTQPTWEEATRIAQQLGVSVDELCVLMDE